VPSSARNRSAPGEAPAASTSHVSVELSCMVRPYGRDTSLSSSALGKLPRRHMLARLQHS
jgi:hypothetical protein